MLGRHGTWRFLHLCGLKRSVGACGLWFGTGEFRGGDAEKDARDVAGRVVNLDQFFGAATFGLRSGRRYRLLPLLNPNNDRPNLTYEFLGVTRVWRWTRERMEQAYRDGIVVQLKPGAVPQYKKYLDESKGRTITNDWWDIDQVAGDESIGYPTQKPLALLDRIIRASSNADDIILDPFCGCATACVAAEKAERQWVGIDLSPKAKDLVELRLKKDLGMFGLETVYRTDFPRRTDVGELPHYRTHKHTLFGRQEGLCNGCGHFFPFRNFTVDHILSRHKAGTDHIDNLQLLCGACNSLKGNRTQSELIAEMRRQGIIE